MALSSGAFEYVSSNGHDTTSLIPVLVLYQLHGKDSHNVFILSCWVSLCSSLCPYLSSCVFVSEEGFLS